MLILIITNERLCFQYGNVTGATSSQETLINHLADFVRAAVYKPNWGRKPGLN